MRYSETELGGLLCYRADLDPGYPWVVLFHGYGADGRDLAPLSDFFYKSKGLKLNWLFPEAPLSVQMGPWDQGRAWFPIDIDALENPEARAQQRMQEELPEGMSIARKKALACLEELGAAPDRTVLGGFSQGAMMATELALCENYSTPRGLAILSGTLLARKRWAARAREKLEGLHFFQSHGSRDPLLPISAARELNRELTEAGLSGTLQEFEGGHEIPQNILIELSQYLARFED